jgi:hypothetical protein
MKYKHSKEKQKEVLKKYVIGGDVEYVSVSEKISKKEKESFLEYVNEYYGKKGIYADQLNGGFTKAELKKSVDKYLKELGNSKTWGGGDSLDRERVRQILEPSYKMFASGGSTGLPYGAEQHYVNHYINEGASVGIFAEGGGVEKVNHFPLDKEKLDKNAKLYADRIKSGVMSTTKKSIENDIEEWKKDLYLLEIGRKRPSNIIGTGYKGDTRKLANTWLLERIYEQNKVLELLKDFNNYEVGGSLVDGYLTDPNFGNFQNTMFANGGSIEGEIDKLYLKSNFINDDFNWQGKLLEMLEDNSVEAYNIYQSLNKKQKQQVLQEQYDRDNDMGSYGDGDIETSKENIEILLEDAKNGNKYIKGGNFFKKGGRLLTQRERYIAELKGLTGLRQSAIDNFIDENNLTNDEILNIVIGLGRKQIKASDVSTAIVGTKDNDEFKKLMNFVKSDKALREYKEGGVTKNYINRNELNTITIKKGDQKLTYKVSDVYNGAYKLEDGGNLEKMAFYVPKRNVVKVQLRSGKDVKVANGYWIKKGAKPIHTSKYDDGGRVDKHEDWEMIVVSKELNKDGGKYIKDRFLVSAKNIEQAKELATNLWYDMYGKDTDLSIVKVMSESLYELRYFDKYDDGGQLKMKFAGGGEIRRFDRNSQMDSETREEILDVLSESDTPRGLTNYLYGLYDGYDYSQTENFKRELKTLKQKNLKLHQRVVDIYEKIDKYKFEKYNDNYDDGGQLEMKFAGGGKIETKIQKKVDEVNALIEKAIDSDGDPLMVVDKTGTWEEPMQYKPIVYKNGRLYFEYFEPYSGKTKKEVVNKSNIDFDGYPMLLNVAKMYRKVLKEKGVSYSDGGALSNSSINYLSDLWFAVQQKDTNDYKMLSKKLDSLKVPFVIQNEVSADAETQRGRKALNISEVHDRIKKIVEKNGRKFASGGSTKRGGSMQLAKEIRKEGESWQSALKRANEQIRKK